MSYKPHDYLARAGLMNKHTRYLPTEPQLHAQRGVVSVCGSLAVLRGLRSLPHAPWCGVRNMHQDEQHPQLFNRIRYNAGPTHHVGRCLLVGVEIPEWLRAATEHDDRSLICVSLLPCG